MGRRSRADGEGRQGRNGSSKPLRLLAPAETSRRQARIAAEAAARVDPGDGWVEVTVPIESVEHASTDFLRIGPEAEVLAPAALRDAMRAAARRLAQIYRD